MRVIPISFHVGPLEVYLYGIGLALTLGFGLVYLRRRLAAAGIPTDWMTAAAFWIALWAMVGARAIHVITHPGEVTDRPADVFAIWQGGLGSFGGLAGGIVAGVVLARRHIAGISVARLLDLAAPVLLAGFGVGRLVMCQVMYAGGGRPTDAWYGVAYHGQPGFRLPAPLFQAAESWLLFAVVIVLERKLRRRPAGFVVAVAAALWGLQRFADEVLWLATPRLWNTAELTAAAVAVAGAAAAVRLWTRRPGAQAASARHELEAALPRLA